MRRALCVGINSYSFGNLQGCVQDAEGISEILATNYDCSPNFDCKVLTAPINGNFDLITRSSLRESIDQLFRFDADIALLFFSGHGTINDLDGYLVTQDANKFDEGVAMSEILGLANNSKANEIVIILDCCFSGSLGRLPTIDNKKALIKEGVAILSASRDDQPSVEVGGEGLFTSLVIDALDGGAADVLGNVTTPSIYAYAEAALGAWDQRPLLKAHLSKLTPLRKCKPVVDLAIIRRIPEIFPLPAEDFMLDPSFESTSRNCDQKNQARFCDLQALNRVHLVIPVGTDHMYDAAMQSKACQLTPTGRYYWRLAKERRI